MYWHLQSIRHKSPPPLPSRDTGVEMVSQNPEPLRPVSLQVQTRWGVKLPLVRNPRNLETKPTLWGPLSFFSLCPTLDKAGKLSPRKVDHCKPGLKGLKRPGPEQTHGVFVSPCLHKNMWKQNCEGGEVRLWFPPSSHVRASLLSRAPPPPHFRISSLHLAHKGPWLSYWAASVSRIN